METPLAVPETGGGMLSPDGRHYVYTPIDRDFRSWKRYRGGRAQDVWTYDLVANTSSALINHPRPDADNAARALIDHRGRHCGALLQSCARLLGVASQLFIELHPRSRHA